jgi:hypothetical protein
MGMFLGPLCTMLAQPETAAVATSTTTTHIFRNIMAPLRIEFVWSYEPNYECHRCGLPLLTSRFHDIAISSRQPFLLAIDQIQPA